MLKDKVDDLLLNTQMSRAAVARAVGCTPTWVTLRAKALGLPPIFRITGCCRVCGDPTYGRSSCCLTHAIEVRKQQQRASKVRRASKRKAIEITHDCTHAIERNKGKSHATTDNLAQQSAR